MALNFKFQYLYFFVSLFLIVLYPSIALSVIVYNALYLMSEALSKGVQASSTPLLRGLVFFGVSFFVSFIVFSVIMPLINVNVVDFPYPVLVTIGFAFIVSGYEEEIYRNILVKVLGNPFIVTGLFALLHFFTGMYVLKFAGVALYSYIIFTFLFGIIMYFLKVHFKSIEVPQAVHFAFLLFNYGLITYFGGV